jgi:hypothetical protein
VITGNCIRGFSFLQDLTDDERLLVADGFQRQQAVADRLGAALVQPARE